MVPALIIGAALVTTLSACSSNQPKHTPQISESFNTQITQDGTKFFTYQLSIKPNREHKRKPPPNGHKHKTDEQKAQARKKMKSKLNQKFEQRLAAKLEETGYCRKGYIALDKNLVKGTASLRGECREAATPKDRRQFTSL